MQAEAREIIKRVIKEALYEEGKEKSILVDGVEVQVYTDNGNQVRFDLPKQERSFILMSGRLYEKPYPKRMEAGVTGKTPEILPDPGPTSIVEQLDYRRKIEKVDSRVFKNKLTCSCGNVRWVKSADLFQVKKCKPCTYRDRNKRRNKSKV